MFEKNGAGCFRPFRLGIFVDHDDLGARIGRRSSGIDGGDNRLRSEVFFPYQRVWVQMGRSQAS